MIVISFALVKFYAFAILYVLIVMQIKLVVVVVVVVWVLVLTTSRIPDRQATKSRIPCPNFGKSRFSGCSQIPNPVKIFCVFPNPAPYFGQIPDPENTLPDPVKTCRQTGSLT